MPLSSVIYRLTAQHTLYEDVNVLLIAIAGLATAATVHVDGKANFNAGDYVTIEGRHLDLRVRLPIHGPVEAALGNRKPDVIELEAVAGRDIERVYAVVTAGFADYVDRLFLPFLVAYFERHRHHITAKYKADRLAWPSSWQMGWAVRNAASHGGIAFDQPTRKSVSWRGLTFGPSDEPARSLLKLLNGADILLLMFEMSQELV
ncbi:hypothetical protein BH11PSE10_BH11PSE10_13760 [soil metagenome]